ncbi:MAG TPA: DUF3570 domain-containing protein [Kofleriaceae bacterium]|nr:DUF3570 domain-containing protein [Kofleriaceae bacterium]
MPLLARTISVTLAALVVIAVTAAGTARADGELTMRGVYYKERSTRVVQPMLDGLFGVGENGQADAHLLVDAITSASVAAGEVLEEKRYEAGGGYRHQLGRLRLGGQARYSTEPDYKSIYGGVSAALELFDKNLTVGLAAGAGHDWINNAGMPSSTLEKRELSNYLGSLSLSQILSENAIISFTYDLTYASGFQANIYRSELINGLPVHERHPEQRTRHALASSLRRFIPGTSTTVVLGYRYYTDDWGVEGHTPEVGVIQDVGDHVTFGLRYRFHTQREADFYRDRYDDPNVMYVSDDAKLSRFDSHTLGARFAIAGAALGFGGLLGAMTGELVIEYVAQDNAFGNAGIAHAALTIPFGY